MRRSKERLLRGLAAQPVSEVQCSLGVHQRQDLANALLWHPLNERVRDRYVELFKKVRATPEWAQLMADGAFNPSFMSGADYAKWVEGEEKRHRDLMKDAGFLANN